LTRGVWLTRWSWFTVQLRLCALERSGPGSFFIRFRFVNRGVACVLSGALVHELLERKASRDEHKEYYSDWIDSVVDDVDGIIGRIPGFRYSPRKSMEFRVHYSYGMGSEAIVIVKGGRWKWREDVPK
jgi:hypothetical protein